MHLNNHKYRQRIFILVDKVFNWISLLMQTTLSKLDYCGGYFGSQIDFNHLFNIDDIFFFLIQYNTNRKDSLMGQGHWDTFSPKTT